MNYKVAASGHKDPNGSGPGIDHFTKGGHFYKKTLVSGSISTGRLINFIRD
jgi:hypothetical protein